MSSDGEEAKEDDANGELSHLDQEMERNDGDNQPTGCKYDQCDLRPSWLPPFVEAMENIRVLV